MRSFTLGSSAVLTASRTSPGRARSRSAPLGSGASTFIAARARFPTIDGMDELDRDVTAVGGPLRRYAPHRGSRSEAPRQHQRCRRQALRPRAQARPCARRAPSSVFIDASRRDGRELARQGRLPEGQPSVVRGEQSSASGRSVPEASSSARRGEPEGRSGIHPRSARPIDPCLGVQPFCTFSDHSGHGHVESRCYRCDRTVLREDPRRCAEHRDMVDLVVLRPRTCSARGLPEMGCRDHLELDRGLRLVRHGMSHTENRADCVEQPAHARCGHALESAFELASGDRELVLRGELHGWTGRGTSRSLPPAGERVRTCTACGCSHPHRAAGRISGARNVRNRRNRTTGPLHPISRRQCRTRFRRTRIR